MKSGGSTMDLATAVAVLDLHAAGVTAEMADVPFMWDAAAPVVAAPIAAAEAVVAAPAPLAPRVVAVAKAESPVSVPVVVDTVVIKTPWVEGDAGGVVILVADEAPAEGAARVLLQAMLAAVGQAQTPLGWVGAPSGGKTDAQALAAALKGLNPARILVLGQEALAALTGTKVGVEGWYARAKQGTLAPALVDALNGAPVGATYPPALLLIQPLLKRLAWRHLLAWTTA